MLYEVSEDDGRSRANASPFWWRLADNLFRRLAWFLLPVVLLGAFGVYQATSTLELYRSSGTISASENPLLPEQAVSGVSVQFLESPAAAAARIINEQLGTDSFLLAVADGAGLDNSLETGEVEIDAVRASVWASADGDSILTVNATWADPQTSHQLATAAIAQYQAYLSDAVASDAAEAEEFYSAQLEARELERDEAIDDLEDYAATLEPVPLGEEQPIDVQIQLDRLANAVSSAETKVDESQDKLEEARFTRGQLVTQAGRSLTVIDTPTVPTAPESSLVERVTIVLGFVVLGFLIAAAALIVTTVLDTSIASPADLMGLRGVEMVATVPMVALPGARSRRLRRRR